MPEQTKHRNRVEEIFHEAQARPTGEAREAYLDGACEGAPELRAEVDALLAAGQQADSYLEKPPALAETINSSVDLTEGSEIGCYKLLQQLGEGGFGVVYMAQQTEPIKRQVAIKIIKPGMDSKEVIARFEAERQALAMMDHPNIAKVLDAGTTPHGRPYFVMELVKGRPITEYCDANHLNTKDRLHLFVQVCNAVQHAHQKGVIHRDLKPSNVMVTLHDGKPVPKVIDFGVSKALSQQLTDKTLFTRYGQIIGTPQYMSPEQAEMSGLDIDTRSDIYSLGVLLYELLTGQTPFDSETLRKAGLEGMRKLICESEPSKPSTKVKTLEGESATLVANHRSSSAIDALSRSFSGDLDWIVMKSLDKDRSRRYETASNLVQDIERHLADEPVHAGPPTLAYQLSKLYRRHRSVVVSLGMIAATLLISLCIAIPGWISALQGQQLARDAQQKAQDAQEETKREEAIAVANQKQAEIERDKAAASQKLMGKLLKAAATRLSPSEARRYLKEALAQIRKSSSDPCSEIELLTLISKVHGREYGAASRFAAEACELADKLSDVELSRLSENPYLRHFEVAWQQNQSKADRIADKALAFAKAHQPLDDQIQTMSVIAIEFSYLAPDRSLELSRKIKEYAQSTDDAKIQWKHWQVRVKFFSAFSEKVTFEELYNQRGKIRELYVELKRLRSVKPRFLDWNAGKLAGLLLVCGFVEEANVLLGSNEKTSQFNVAFGNCCRIFGELAYAHEHLAKSNSSNPIWIPVQQARTFLLGRRLTEAKPLYESGRLQLEASDTNLRDWSGLWIDFELAYLNSKVGEDSKASFKEVYEQMKKLEGITLYGEATDFFFLLAGTFARSNDPELAELSQSLANQTATEFGRWLELASVGEHLLSAGHREAAFEKFVEAKSSQRGWLGEAFAELVDRRLVEYYEQNGQRAELLKFLEENIEFGDRNFQPNHPKRAFARIDYLEEIGESQFDLVSCNTSSRRGEANP